MFSSLSKKYLDIKQSLLLAAVIVGARSGPTSYGTGMPVPYEVGRNPRKARPAAQIKIHKTKRAQKNRNKDKLYYGYYGR